MEHLDSELGQPITPAALARWLGVDVKTVRKYADRWGGVEVAPKRLLFFERIVAAKIRAAAMQPPEPAPREVKPQPHQATKEQPRKQTRLHPHHKPGKKHDPYGLLS